MTHPEILRSYITGGIEPAEDTEVKCFMCGDITPKRDSVLHYDKYWVCSYCGNPSVKDLMQMLSEERGQTEYLERQLSDIYSKVNHV
jgi:hypothetical protein